jgi:hypothetical protein
MRARRGIETNDKVRVTARQQERKLQGTQIVKVED